MKIVGKNRCVDCAIEIPLRRARGKWIRFCGKCQRAMAMRKMRAMSPKQLSEWGRRGGAALSREQHAEAGRKSAIAKMALFSPQQLSEIGRKAALARMAALSPEQRAQSIRNAAAGSVRRARARFAAIESAGVYLCPHCKSHLPLECFPKSNRRLGGLDLSCCLACHSIHKRHSAYPVIIKRTGKLHVPFADFHGFRGGQAQLIYEWYWAPKLESNTE
jgi:hypothetical protein